MSAIDLVTVVSALGGSTVAADAAKEIYRYLTKALRERGAIPAETTIEGPEDIATVEASFSRTLQPNQIDSIANEALDAGHRSAVKLRDERLRQAKISFNAAVALLVIGVLIILAGIAGMFLSAVAAGAVSTAVGAVVEIASALLFRFNTETNNRLDEIGNYLSSVEAAQVAMRIASKIEDPQKRDDAIRDAARSIAALSTTHRARGAAGVTRRAARRQN